MKRTVLQWGLPVVAVSATVAVMMALTAFKPPVEKSEDTRQVAALSVAPARAEQVRVSVSTQGEVRAKTDIQVIPEVSGRVVAVHNVYAEGGAFTPDTVLLQIDDTQYKLAVIRAEASVAGARVVLEQELADAKIKEKQWSDWNKDGKPTALALNKPQVAEAQARLRAAEADLEEAKLNLERTQIRMPFEGRVSERNVGVGQYVAAGTPLGRVFATDVVEIRLPLTDRQLGELGLNVGFVAGENSTSVDAVLTAEMGGIQQRWYAKVVRTQASIDSATRLFYAIAEVRDPYKTSFGTSPLPVGLFVQAEIEGVTAHDGILIPRSALRGENTVYVVEDDKLRIHEVTVLSTDSDQAIISNINLDGADVVTSPVRSAFEGMPVRVTNTQTAKSSQASQTVASAAGALR